MVSPQGEKLWLGGVYREIVKNEKLIFTQAWDGGNEETLVTVRFADHPRGTKMLFAQSGFASAGSCAGHEGGWTECFVLLARHLAGVQTPRKASGDKKP